MATRDKFRTGIIFVAIVVVFALAALLTPTPSAHAESVGAISLTPIKTDNADVKYYCFENPLSVFADGAGIVVACENGFYNVSGETEVTQKRDIPADKVYRHLEHGEHSEYIIVLSGGRITLYCGDAEGVVLSASDGPLDGIADFAVYGDTLYAVSGGSLISALLGAESFDASVAVTALHSPRYNDVRASHVATVNGTVYVVTQSAFGSRNDVCFVSDGGELMTALLQSDGVLSMTADNAALYTLTRDAVIKYSVAASGGLIKKSDALGAEFIDIYTYGGNVYALDSLNALHRLSGELSSDTVLLASSSDVKGYFNMPSDIAVKNSTIYVADTLNDRIAIYGDSIEYTEREFINPVSVYRDSASNVYVAYEYNKIGIFAGGDFSEENERTVFAPELGYIVQIAVDAEKTIYILSSTGLWTLENSASRPVLSDATRYKAITLGVGRNGLYALSDEAVYKLDGGGKTKACDAPDTAVSIAADLDGSVYILTRNSILCVKSDRTEEYSLSVGGEPYTLGGGLGRIVLCTVHNAYASHGDVLIADGYKHRIFKADGTALGVTLIDENYVVPDVANSSDPAFYGDGLIRTATRNTEVFARPMESEPIYTIARGRNVIVPVYTLEETLEYSLVLIDDTERGRLVQGYVFRDSLSAPLPYVAPPAAVGTVFNSATPIYKFPSRHSRPVRGYSAVDDNTKLDMLDFVEAFRDDYNNLWYRVKLGADAEGFILAVNLSISNYEPVFIRPAYNAEIISYKNSEFAVGYELSADGKYTEITALPVGTQVEVVGAFDSSKEYTEVKFTDGERGTMSCYVKTVYIRYNGVNIVLLVAIIVIMITVILASIIVARVMRNKKQNLVDDETPEED